MNRRLVTAILASGLVLNGVASHAACSTANVRGTWGFKYETTDFDVNPPRYCAGVGFMTFGGATLSSNTVRVVSQRGSCDGSTFATASAAGSYTVTSACIGTSNNLNYTNGASARLTFNVIENNSRIQFLMTLDGATLHGEAFKRD
jgi:hypothetical protein